MQANLGRRPYNRKEGASIDWSDAEDLAQYTAKEIAKMKGCSQQAARRALAWRGFSPKRIRGVGEHGPDKPYGVVDKPTVIEVPPEVKLNCKLCGQPLVIVPWNKVVNMATCENSGCRQYGRPVMDEALKINA